MARLSLRLLGQPQIDLDGRTVRFDTRKAVALLAYLACQDSVQRRDTIAALLWPEYDQGRAALRRTLSAIQSVLGDGWLISDRDTLALQRSAAIWVDVGAFEALVRTPEPTIANLCAALALHRDDFLAGFSLRDSPSFDDWQIAQAEHLRLARLQALARLVQLEEQSGALDGAIISARQWLTLDPLQEQAHRTLIRLLYSTGQRSAALKQYRECVRVLDRELGVGPLDETTALYQAIVSGQLPAPLAQPAPMRPSPSSTTTLPHPAPPPPHLIGRAHEWSTLIGAYQSIQANGLLIALVGPSGIGKTRLAHELMATARTRAATVLTVRCYEGEAQRAYAPWIGLLQQLSQSAEARQRLSTLPAWAQLELAHLVPTDQGVPPAGHPTGDRQLRLFDSIRLALQALCPAPAPLLVLLDDMQWADASSLDLVAYLGRRLSGLPIGLLLAWRPEDLASDHLLPALIAELRRAGSAQTILLTPLDRAGVLSFLQATPGIAARADQLADQLFNETEGLPLLLVEYLATLQHAPDSAASLQGLPIPGGARDLLHARVRHVSPLGAQILATAAVIGRTFEPEIVRLASGRTEDEVIEGLEELTRLGIIVEGESYDFSHGKLRDLVYTETSLARRRLLHRRVAEALTSAPGAATRIRNAGVIAQHYLQAGLNTLAAEQFVLAGRHAHTLAALTTALGHYEMALALDIPDPSVVHELIGDIQTLLGRYAAALASYEVAAAGAHAERLAALEAQIASIHQRRGDWALATQHLDAGLNLLTTESSRALRAWLTAELSLTCHQAGQRAEAQRLAAEAHALAEQSGDRRALAQAYNLLGLLANDAGDPAQACAQLTRSLELASRLGDTRVRMAALNNLALAHAANGELDQAIQLAEQALALCEALGDRHRAAAIHNNIADFLHSAGDDARAHERLTHAVTIFASIGNDTEHLHPTIWKLTAW